MAADYAVLPPQRPWVRYIVGITIVLLVIVSGAWVLFFHHDNNQAAQRSSSSGTKQSRASGSGTKKSGDGSTSANSHDGNTPDKLSDTGPGNVVAIFVGATLVATAAHYVHRRRRMAAS